MARALAALIRSSPPRLCHRRPSTRRVHRPGPLPLVSDCSPRHPLHDSLQFPDAISHPRKPRRDTSIYPLSASHAHYLSSPARQSRFEQRQDTGIAACEMDGLSVDGRLGNLTAVTAASSLRPCLAGFTLFNANSISSLPSTPEARDSIRQERYRCVRDGWTQRRRIDLVV
ncbi:hypothetical protein FB45DRAFT_1118670 [Roridomyces roridus]|uniref:Uncharacterized protein n=1 Tax=Roridomyces roridus TaxID=1738132 RepID=A0AAD7B5W5_9AGAR|nr:hypothetical protein FB45DRAFT_1118670 [Roridomyces roridus]